MENNVDPNFPADLTTFSSISVQSVAYSYVEKTFITGDFTRCKSFPARCSTYGPGQSTVSPSASWASLPIPEDGSQLTLKLGDKLGEGGIGCTYSAELRSPTTFGIPSDGFVIKIAKPEFCRALAREAWFYEQLYREGNCIGIIAPRCFGLFTLQKNKLDERVGGKTAFVPWYDSKIGIGLEDDEPWLLRDDFPSPRYKYDLERWDESSPWKTYTPSPDDPRIAILLLERLGSEYPLPQGDKEALRDIEDVVTDLTHTGITHGDLRFNNVLRTLSPKDAPLCPRHKTAHRWRLIDFNKSSRTIFTEEIPRNKVKCFREREYVGDRYFLGQFEP